MIEHTHKTYGVNWGPLGQKGTHTPGVCFHPCQKESSALRGWKGPNEINLSPSSQRVSLRTGTVLGTQCWSLLLAFWYSKKASDCNYDDVPWPMFLSGAWAMKEVYLCCCACVLSRVRLFVTLWTVAHQAPLSMGFTGKNTEVGCISFSRGSSWPRDWTHISCALQADSLSAEPWQSGICCFVSEEALSLGVSIWQRSIYHSVLKTTPRRPQPWVPVQSPRMEMPRLYLLEFLIQLVWAPTVYESSLWWF